MTAQTVEEKATSKQEHADAKATKRKPVSAIVLADGKPYADPMTHEGRKPFHVDDHPDENIEELVNSFLKVAEQRYHDLGFGTEGKPPVPKLEVSIEYEAKT